LLASEKEPALYRSADPSPLTNVKDLRDIDSTNLREVGAVIDTGELSKSSQFSTPKVASDTGFEVKWIL